MAAYASLLSLMQLINLLQHHRRPPISLHNDQLHLLTQKVTFLQTFLENYNPHLPYTTEADPLESRITDAAYAAEDAIESHIVDQIKSADVEKITSDDEGEITSDYEVQNISDYEAENRSDYEAEIRSDYEGEISDDEGEITTDDEEKVSFDGLYESLEKVIEELALIQKEAMETKHNVAVHTKSTPPDSLRCSSTAQESILVGIDDIKHQLMEYMTIDVNDLEIIPIVGMGGSGKTTLAQTIYENPFIKKHFTICAWTTISQEYTISRIIKEILQVNEKVGQHLSDGELGEMLHKHLYNRKYLIILDDMWNIEACEQVKKYLPNNKNGSRIVVTTRLSNVASTLSNSNRLEMKLLDEADSWDLLSQIVFRKKGCPPELEEIGKKIGKSCKGLPMSIVVVGGFLAKSEHTVEFWEYIEENLNSIVNLEDDERCLKTLHMSYKQLPVYLRPCFLYMGVFREDEEIRVTMIVKLWVAEGFLKPVEGKRLEDIAKENLKDLVDRNLVIIHEVGSIGNMKYCRVHDLLRDFCLREAHKERLYGVVSLPATHQGIVNGQRRTVISIPMSYNDISSEALSFTYYNAKKALLSMPLTRSFVWNSGHRELQWFSYNLLNFRLLRILHPCSKIPTKVANFLVNSRFLALSDPSDDYIFPHSVWLFWNLQILTFRGISKVRAPTDFWYMSHIRHVWIRNLHLPDPPNSEDDIVLENLHTLGVIRNFMCSALVVKRIPNIIKLGIHYRGTLDADEYCLNNLDRLDKLESLTYSFHQEYNPRGPTSLHSLINFPHSLKKLTLYLDFSPYWDDILDKIGVLPVLQKLKLEQGRFRENEWVTIKGHFRKLKFLFLQYCYDLQVWTAESSHFPCLEHLILNGITELMEIPLEFAEISSLKVIKLKRCSDSALESAEEMSNEHEKLYGAAIQVQVE